MAQIGYTSTFSVNDGSSNAQAVFADVKTVNVPFGETSIINYSVLGQGNRSLQKAPGMHDDGNCEFELYYTKADFQRLVALKGKKHHGTTTATAVTWVVTTFDEDGTTATLTPLKTTFTGILSKIDPPVMDNDNLPVIKGTIAVYGGVTYENGTNQGS